MQRLSVPEFFGALESGATKDGDRIVPEGMEVTADFVYVRRPQRDLKLDVYDGGAGGCGLRPALVFVHGGGWFQGTRHQFARHAAYFAQKYGMCCLSVEYRFSQEATFPACLEDVKCAVRWLNSEAEARRIDSRRIGICGTSSGGHLAALLCATNGASEYDDAEYAGYSSAAQLCLLLNPVLDLIPMAMRPGHVGESARKVMACDPVTDRARWVAASPYLQVTEKMPPTVLLHGDADDGVVVEQSMMFHEKLLRLGVPSELKICSARQHGWHKHGRDFVDVLGVFDAFLRRHFQLKRASEA